MLSQQSLTSERRPFSHSIGSLTLAPAARYQSHAASRSVTFTARLAIPTTPMRGIVGFVERSLDLVLRGEVGIGQVRSLGARLAVSTTASPTRRSPLQASTDT